MKIEDKFDTVENFLEFLKHYSNEEFLKDGTELLTTKYVHILNKLNNGLYTLELDEIIEELLYQRRDIRRNGFPLSVFRILILIKKENDRYIKKEEFDIYEFIGKRS